VFAFSCFKHNFISHLIESVHVNSFGKIDVTDETADNRTRRIGHCSPYSTLRYIEKRISVNFVPSDRDTEISIPFCRFPLWSIARCVDTLPSDAGAAYAWCGRNACTCVHISRRTFQSKRSGYWRGEELPCCMGRGCNESCWDFLRRMRRWLCQTACRWFPSSWEESGRISRTCYKLWKVSNSIYLVAKEYIVMSKKNGKIES